MDTADLLRRARRLAGFTATRLAREAGTSRAALHAYEQGRRSPTVATLDRLLAACDLQLPARLEPRMADLDALVDRLIEGPGPLPWGFAELVGALDAAAVPWAAASRPPSPCTGCGPTSRTWPWRWPTRPPCAGACAT